MNDLVPHSLERLGWWCSVDAELGRGCVVVVLSGGVVQCRPLVLGKVAGFAKFLLAVHVLV